MHQFKFQIILVLTSVNSLIRKCDILRGKGLRLMAVGDKFAMEGRKNCQK